MALLSFCKKLLNSWKGQHWERGREKLCFWFLCLTGWYLGALAGWQHLGWSILDKLADVTASASEIVVEDWGPAPCPVSKAKRCKTCWRGGAGSHLRPCWAGTRRGPWRRGGWSKGTRSTRQLLIHFLIPMTLPLVSLLLSLLKLN